MPEPELDAEVNDEREELEQKGVAMLRVFFGRGTGEVGRRF